MRQVLERLSLWFAARGKRRLIMDHVDPTKEYLYRTYLFGGERDKQGKLIHRRWEVCLHKILRSDDDGLHNHPGAYFSLILAGSYREHTPDGVFVRRPGHMRVRGKRSLHRLEIVDGPVWTLFVFLNRPPGKSRWQFLVNGRLVPHRIHLNEND